MTTGFLLIPIDGPLEVIDPAGDSLAALQAGVEGDVQCVALDASLDMWVNEEGKFYGLRHNLRAQGLWDAKYGPGTDFIVGRAVLTGGVGRDGETLPLDAAAIEELTARVGG